MARVVVGAVVEWSVPPDDAGRRIYIANHSSHFDFVAIWATLPGELRRQTRPVAAEEYWTRGRLRIYFARNLFNAVLVRRSTGGEPAEERRRLAIEGVTRMLEALDAGASLILFPEGTRGTGEAIAPFRSGLFHLCRQRPDVDVVPVHLVNLNRLLPKGHVIPLPIVTRISFGRPFRLSNAESEESFLNRARESVAGLGVH